MEVHTDEAHPLTKPVVNIVSNDEIERLRRNLRKSQREAKELRSEVADLSKRLKWNRSKVKQLETDLKARQAGLLARARALFSK